MMLAPSSAARAAQRLAAATATLLRMRPTLAGLLDRVELAQVDAMLQAEPSRHVPRVVDILRVAPKLGTSPEARTALRDALLDPSGSAGGAAIAYLESGEERATRRAAAAVLGRQLYEVPDALDRLGGTGMTPPSDAERLAAEIVGLGRPSRPR